MDNANHANRRVVIDVRAALVSSGLVAEIRTDDGNIRIITNRFVFSKTLKYVKIDNGK